MFLPLNSPIEKVPIVEKLTLSISDRRICITLGGI
jgi:hypothetical protein